LAKRGLEGSVWRPALNCGLDYDSLSWSGENRHKARVAGAKKLSATLGQLADKCQADGYGKMRVNIVAHSHGGNVALEALRSIKDNVEIGRVVLLGTPLLSARPSLRLLRLLVAYLMITLVFLLGLVAAWELISVVSSLFHASPGAAPAVSGDALDRYVGWLVIPALVFYGWAFYLLAGLGDIVWRILLTPITLATGRWSGQVYGPSPSRLREKLGREPVVLVTSHHDEAALLLAVCSSPRKLYVDMVNDKLKEKRVLLFLERLSVRPIMVGLILRCSEVLLERVALGASRLKLLFFDHEMADLEKGSEYPQTVLRRIDVTEQLKPVVEKKRLDLAVVATPPVEAPGLKPGGDRHVESLRNTLVTAWHNVMSQVKLRHSLYYDNDIITEIIADIIVKK
jgi:pimeloyl-ACP methyl ester carboxylesterase